MATKTVNCKQLSGLCDFPMTVSSEEELSAAAWKHASEAHPEVVEKMKNMTPEDKAKKDAHFHKVWEETPNDPE